LWQFETDPLVGLLWAESGGKLRLREQQTATLHKYADNDQEVVALFRAAQEKAADQKAKGYYAGTSPYTSLNHVTKYLKSRAEQRARAKVEPDGQLVEK